MIKMALICLAVLALTMTQVFSKKESKPKVVKSHLDGDYVVITYEDGEVKRKHIRDVDAQTLYDSTRTEG